MSCSIPTHIHRTNPKENENLNENKKFPFLRISFYNLPWKMHPSNILFFFPWDNITHLQVPHSIFLHKISSLTNQQLLIEKSMEKWSQIEFKFQRRLNRDCVGRLSCYDERHRLNSTCVCTLILFITVSRRAVNRDYDDRARHRERSRSRSVSGRGGTSGRGRNFARKWLAAVLSFPPISFPRQRVRWAGRSWWKVFQRLIFER